MLYMLHNINFHLQKGCCDWSKIRNQTMTSNIFPVRRAHTEQWIKVAVSLIEKDTVHALNPQFLFEISVHTAFKDTSTSVSLQTISSWQTVIFWFICLFLYLNKKKYSISLYYGYMLIMFILFKIKKCMFTCLYICCIAFILNMFLFYIFLS